MSYPIDPHKPSELFLKARDAAGVALQEQFKREGGKVEPPIDYKWVKAELTWPSFDHLTFGYGNQIFSVLVDLIGAGVPRLTEQEINRCVEACEANHLIPCAFQIDARSMRPLSVGWNLSHLVTHKPVVPNAWASTDKIEMSEWELQNFCIQIVRNHIKEIGGEVMSFCDVPAINPQIWFKDTSKNRAWVVVRHFPKITGDEKSAWIDFEKSNPQLSDFDGYLAAVSIASGEPILLSREGTIIPPSQRFSGDAPLYRGDKFYIKFDGLQRIFVS
jgi:hypothetical protein